MQCSVKLHHHKNFCEYILLASSYCIYVCFYLSLKLTFVIAWCYHFPYNFLALSYGYLRIWIFFFSFFFLYWKTLFSKQIWFKTVGFFGGRMLQQCNSTQCSNLSCPWKWPVTLGHFLCFLWASPPNSHKSNDLSKQDSHQSCAQEIKLFARIIFFPFVTYSIL